MINGIREIIKNITYKHLAGEHPQRRHGNRGASALPDVIQTMIDQMGGRGLNGAFVYVGAQNLMYNNKTQEGYPNETRYDPKNGTIDMDTGLTFNVNMGKGSQWKMVVAYRPNVLTVYFYGAHSAGSGPLKRGRWAKR